MSRLWRISCLLALGASFLLSGCAHNPRQAAQDLLAESQTYRQQGKFKSAAIEIRRALQVQPQSIPAYRALADLELDQQHWTTAYAALREIVNLDPQNRSAWLDLGRLYIRNREWTEAQKAARTVLTVPASTAAERAAAHQLLATVAAGQHAPATALKEFQQVTRLQPRDPNAWINLALAERGTGDPHAAAADLHHAIQVAPHAALAWVDLVRLQQSEQHASLAHATLQQALAANPRSTPLWLLQADLDYQPAQPGAAMRDLSTLLQRQPHSSVAALAVGNWYLAHGNAPTAIRTFQSGLTPAHTGTPQAQLHAALLHAYLSTGQWQAAQALSAQMLKNDPQDATARLAEARVLLAQGAAAKALPTLRTLAQQAPDTASVLYTLGQAEWQTGDLPQGLQDAERANQLQPNQPACLQLLCRMEQASGDLSSAQHYADQFAQSGGDPAAAYRLQGEIALRAGSPAQAVKDFTAAGLAQSQHPADAVLLARAAESAGQFAVAGRQLQRALRQQPGSPTVTGALVHLQVQQHNWKAADATISGFCVAHPHDAAGPWLAGTLALARHQDAVAASDWHRALAMQPGYLQAELDLGRLRQQQGNLTRALDWYQRALQQQPKFAPLLTLVGNLYLEQSQWATAAQFYHRALADQPSFAVAEANLAWVETEQGRNLNDALSWAERAAKSSPHEASVQDTLGWVYYKLGSYNAALPILAQCVAEAPRTPMYRFHLGMAQIAAGRRRQGAAQLRQALALQLPAPAATQARAALGASARR